MKNKFFTGIIFCLVFTFCTQVNAQLHTDQNGLKSSVISNLSANNLQAIRYEVATLGFNSHHWQAGGIIIVELFQQSFSTGYQKYIINNGFGVGINSGETKLNLVESEGQEQHAKVTLGTPYNLATDFGGYINKALPIYIDVKYYTRYRVKITYQQERVDNLDYINQIKINEAPVPIAINDFSVPLLSDNPLTSTSNLMVTGEGIHYISKGNVGIGTINPTAKLEVLGGNIAVSGNLLVSTGNATGGGIKLADDGDIVDLNDGWATHRFSNGIRITNANGGGNPVIQLANNNVTPTYFTVGNVGIGTSTPAGLLHLNGAYATPDGGNSYQFAGTGLVVQANTGGRMADRGAQIEFVVPASIDGSNPWGQGRIITVAGNSNNGDATGKMILGTRRSFNKNGKPEEWFYGDDIIIAGNGNVGVNTLNPIEKLTVNGKIKANEIRVDGYGAPDYVFDKDYQVATLEALESYIKTNKHLPEVPSAAEFERDGIAVGEMNKLLLKKIEELTLHLIAKEKELKSQAARLLEIEKILKIGK